MIFRMMHLNISLSLYSLLVGGRESDHPFKNHHYPLVICYIAVGNHHFSNENPLLVGGFNPMKNIRQLG